MVIPCLQRILSAPCPIMIGCPGSVRSPGAASFVRVSYRGFHIMLNGSLAEEISKRRTFAIISHPDAGKTTLTEKLLLFGGAIQMAGTVKGRKAARHATSDWMRLEQQRGISVTTSVMTFDYDEIH